MHKNIIDERTYFRVFLSKREFHRDKSSFINDKSPFVEFDSSVTSDALSKEVGGDIIKCEYIISYDTYYSTSTKRLYYISINNEEKYYLVTIDDFKSKLKSILRECRLDDILGKNKNK